MITDGNGNDNGGELGTGCTKYGARKKGARVVPCTGTGDGEAVGTGFLVFFILRLGLLVFGTFLFFSLVPFPFPFPFSALFSSLVGSLDGGGLNEIVSLPFPIVDFGAITGAEMLFPFPIFPTEVCLLS